MKTATGAEWLTGMDREEWLRERSKSLGASDVPTIMGLNSFASPLNLWSRLRGTSPPIEENEAMCMGHVMEPVIADLFAKETGRDVKDYGILMVRKDFIHATPDRMFSWDEGSPVIAEVADGVLDCKNVGPRMTQHWSDSIPLYVQCQVQVQLYCCDKEHGAVAALLAGSQFVWKDVERNDEFIGWMLKKCGEFWDCVQNGKMPESGPDDADTLNQLFPKHRSELDPLMLPVEVTDITTILDDSITLKKELDDDISRHKNRIKQILGEHEYGVLPDGSKWRWSTEEVKEEITLRKAYTKRVLRRIKA